MEKSPSQKFDAYPLLYPAFNFVLGRMYDREVVGGDTLPDESLILVANHLRMVDSPLVAAAYTESTGRPVRFGAKREYFDGRGIAKPGDPPKYGRSIKWFMEHTHMVSVDRDAKSPAAFKEFEAQMSDRLQRGDSIALHPEGTRSLDGRLHKFRTGAARLALSNEVTLQPVGLVYTETTGEKPFVSIRFGEPMYPDEFSHYRRNAALISDNLERRVAELTHQKRSNSFGVIPRLILPESDEEAL